MQVSVEIPGRPVTSYHFVQVSPSYFATTGARILAGRTFGAADGPQATPVVTVNQEFVRRFMAGANPIGAWSRIEGATARSWA
jgi:hypothetical protein